MGKKFKAQKWVFDVTNSRVVTEDDTVNIFYTDNLECSNKVIEKVVELHNKNVAEYQLGSEGAIDQYLMDEEECSQEAREEIGEEIFANYYEKLGFE